MRTNKASLVATTPAQDPWEIFEYEVEMFFGTRTVLCKRKRNPAKSDIATNALTESALLHTRILADILLDRKDDDNITLSLLLPDWRASQNLGYAIAELKTAYGNRNIINSPYWSLNKMLAHPSSLRGKSYDYSALLKAIDPIITRAIREISGLSNRSRFKNIELPSDTPSEQNAPVAYTTSTMTSIVTRTVADDK